MPHGRRIAIFLPFFLVILIAPGMRPLSAQAPAENSTDAESSPPKSEESVPVKTPETPRAKPRDEPVKSPPDQPAAQPALEEEIDLKELQPVVPPGVESGRPDAGDGRYQPDGPLEPLTRSPELMPPPRKFRSILQFDLMPMSRLGLQGFYTERRNRNRFNVAGTGSFFGEYKLEEHASIYAVAPYTRKEPPESSAREHIDNVQAGMTFAPGRGPWRPAMGFRFYFATGDEDLGIGSHNKGNLETYAGFIFAGSTVSAQGALRYNAQSNLELNPPPGVKFQRTWQVDLALGIRLDPVEFVLEVTRKGRVAPSEDSLWSTVMTPGINLGGDRGFVLSLGIPFTLSRGREYDYGVVLRGMWVFP